VKELRHFLGMIQYTSSLEWELIPE
jgi:hypothetical protein